MSVGFSAARRFSGSTALGIRGGLLVASGAASGALLIGAAVAYGLGELLIAVAILIGLAWVSWGQLVYLFPAALLLLTMNGVPGLNTERYVVPGSFRPEDVFVIGLILFALGRMLLESRRPIPRLQRYLWVWLPAFLLVWLAAMVRGLDAGAPFLKASLYGRDFLFFAVLAPLAGYLFTERENRRGFLIVVGSWTAAFSGLLIFAQLGLVDPAVVNPHLIGEPEGLLRIYTPMTGLITLTFALSLAYVLVGSSAHSRWVAVIAVLTGLASIFTLTRVLYLSVGSGIVVGVAIWGMRRGFVSRRLRLRLIGVVATLGVIGLMAVILLPGTVGSEPVQTVSTRAQSTLTELADTAPRRTVSSLAKRQYVTDELIRHMGNQWPVGLGFVPPTTYYVTGVPHGSIRNPDLGVLNGVITIGVVGTALFYVPVVLMLGMIVGHVRRRWGRWEFLPLGLTIWGVAIILGSVTLSFLYSTPGLILTALMLGLAAQAMGDTGDDIEVDV